MKNVVIIISFLLAVVTSFAQDPLLISGPMIGNVEHRSAIIWYEVNQDVKQATIRYWQENNTDYFFEVDYVGELGKTYNPIHFELGKLMMATKYQYELRLNGKILTTPTPTFFTTKDLWEWRRPAPDFSFLMGSCTYINDKPYDRPEKAYGQDPVIFRTMADMPSDFMLWLGDNVYFRESDYSSVAGMSYRYSYQRRHPDIQLLLKSRPNFAIWDDHDYGSNDGNKTFALKESSLVLFKNYWGNKSYGEKDNEGIYSTFQQSDCEFFLTDNRYYRCPNQIKDSIGGNPNCAKEFFGKEQLSWLKNSLLSSDATFKFIAVGNQVLNDNTDKESMRHYTCEFNELIAFITDYKIEGVVFLTGDRHFSEVNFYQPNKGYKLYDITSSPLTSGVVNLTGKPELNNPNRVPNTLVAENNFTRISVEGQGVDRKLKMITLNKLGEVKAEFELKASELKFEK
jgi:alkaline phosphatase D